jgi:hypothetical protein
VGIRADLASAHASFQFPQVKMSYFITDSVDIDHFYFQLNIV